MSRLFPMNGIEAIFTPKTIEDVRPKRIREEQRPEANADSESFGQVLEKVDKQVLEKVDKKEAAQSHQSAEGAESVAREHIEDDKKEEDSLETVGSPMLENSGNDVIQPVFIKLEGEIVYSGETVVKIEENGLFSAKEGRVEPGLGQTLETPVSNIVLNGENKNISEEKGMTFSERSRLKGSDRHESNAKIPLEGMHLIADDSEETIEIRSLGDAETLDVPMKVNKEVPKGETRSKSVDEHSMKLSGEKPVLDSKNDGTGFNSELEDGSEQKEKFLGSRVFIKTSSSDVPAVQESTSSTHIDNRSSFNLPDKAAIVSQVTEQFKGLQPGGIEKVRFQLEPKTLGSLEIEITVQKGSVVAHIVTADFSVKELLEGHQTLLRQNLAEQGFQIDKFSVDVGEMGASFYDKRDDLQFMKDRHPFPQVGGSEAVQLGALQIAKGMGLINLYV